MHETRPPKPSEVRESEPPPSRAAARAAARERLRDERARLRAGAPPTGIARGVHAVARGASRFPKTTILLWMALIVACVVGGGMAGTHEITDRDGVLGDSSRAQIAILDAGLDDRPTEAVLVQGKDRATIDRVAAQITEAVDRLDQVSEVASPLPSGGSVAPLRGRNGTDVLLQVSLRGSPVDASKTAAPVTAAVDRIREANPGIEIHQAGSGSVGDAIDEMVASDLRRAELLSVPLTLLILVLAFGAIVAASVPLILGITAVAGAMGAVGMLSQWVPAGESTGSLVVLIGLAVGVDYSLFYVRREREERRAGNGLAASLEASAASVGRAILVSGLTVMVALAGLLLTGVPEFRSMAIGTIVVVAIALLGSLTVLPAMLTLLGDRVEAGRLRLPGAKRRAARRTAAKPRTPRRGAWAVVATAVTNRPTLSLGIALLVLAALAFPATGMKLGDAGTASLPAGIPAIDASAAIERAFPGSPDQARLVVTGDGLDAAASERGLARLGDRAIALTEGAGGATVAVAQDGRTAVVDVPMPDHGTEATQSLVKRLRTEIQPQTATLVPGATSALIGGNAAETVDFNDNLSTTGPLVGAFVLGLAFLLLLAAFRSPRLALTVVALNLLSVGAAYGVMTAVFQNTWAEDLLGFTSSGTITTWLPLVSFVILFGLSMDYSILVLERIREARTQGSTPREAAAEGVAATAGTVTGAAIVMVAVFSIFATLRMLEMKQLGVGLASAILIDATIVRAIALPAAVTLLGERAFPMKAPFRRAERVCDDGAMANAGLIRSGADA
jgi:RND superfamily putative drug exporter